MSSGLYRLRPALLWVLLASAACSFTAIRHDEAKAALSALEFGEVAFLAGDFDRAYALLADVSRAHYSRETIAEALAKMNSPAHPTSLKATDFEPVPGQELVNIFLAGEDGKEKYYYRIEVSGTEAKGYQVSGFFRARDQHPPSQLRRPLPETPERRLR